MIKFDTIDKKPKLYNLAVMTLLFAAAVAALALTGAEEHKFIISALCLAYLLAGIFMIQRAFVNQLKYNPYSYNTIVYTGFTIYVLLLFIVLLINSIRMSASPSLYVVSSITAALRSSAQTYMYLSLPFIFIFSAGLCVSNISLIRHEGKSLNNILGIIISAATVGFFAFIISFDYYSTGSAKEVMIHDLIAGMLYSVFIYLECMMLGTIISNVIITRYKPEYDKDFVIILGCRIRKDGTPTPLLKGRADRALEFYERQKEATGKELIFITSGGQGDDEIMPESLSIKNYLIERGVLPELVIEENKSTSTLENMKFSKEIIDKINPDGKVIFSTSNYHVFRSGICARRVKLRATGIGKKTKWYFWPNASVREFAGLMTNHRGKQIAILLGIIAAYSAITVLSYM